MNDVTAIVLAAGTSSRLGRPKQLEPIGGVPLVRRAALAALSSGASDVIVVAGAALGPVRAAIDGLAVRVVVNADFERGVGTSIRAGIAALGPVSGAIVMTCDQPAATGAHLARLVAAFQGGGHLAVASGYAGVAGVPALFDATLFAELGALGDEEGGKLVLARHAARVLVVPLSAGELDVDTEADARAARDAGLGA